MIPTYTVFDATGSAAPIPATVAPLLPESTPYQRAILFALNRLQKHVYAGTVPAPEIARRRAKSKAARIARRQNRSK